MTCTKYRSTETGVKVFFVSTRKTENMGTTCTTAEFYQESFGENAIRRIKNQTENSKRAVLSCAACNRDQWREEWKFIQKLTEERIAPLPFFIVQLAAVVVGTARHIDGMSLEFGYCQCGKQSTTGKQSAGRQQATNKEEFFIKSGCHFEKYARVRGVGSSWRMGRPVE